MGAGGLRMTVGRSIERAGGSGVLTLYVGNEKFKSEEMLDVNECVDDDPETERRPLSTVSNDDVLFVDTVRSGDERNGDPSGRRLVSDGVADEGSDAPTEKVYVLIFFGVWAFLAFTFAIGVVGTSAVGGLIDAGGARVCSGFDGLVSSEMSLSTRRFFLGLISTVCSFSINCKV